MENYEELLNSAYESIKPVEECDRFEIKKIEGHIEGTKTIVSNFIQIAACLRREPEHLAKFLFRELAAPGEIIGDRLILTRKISSQKIGEKIQQYVDKFVLCSNCKKPDTELVEENNQKYLRCLACGTKKIVVSKI